MFIEDSIIKNKFVTNLDAGTLHLVQKLSLIVEQIKAQKQSFQQFKWFNSELIKAIKQGHWLILDNVEASN